jgi:carbonic anhydrase
MADNPDVTHVHAIPKRYLEQSHERLFENNRAWVQAKKEADPDFFQKLNAGQAPEYL